MNGRVLKCKFRILLSGIIIAIIGNTNLSAQTGSISGMITERFTNDTLPFVYVVILDKNHDTIALTSDGYDGRYEISDIPPGKYKLKATYQTRGFFKPFKMKLLVLPGSHQVIDIQLKFNNVKPTVIINASKPRVSLVIT